MPWFSRRDADAALLVTLTKELCRLNKSTIGIAPPRTFPVSLPLSTLQITAQQEW
jgi:hypothetical protein